eukprot:TRINITY_DN11825_c0_g1_i1.p1 TRINITY_DN11825_c0_g1~~TRINITY_DN11825_c0_g1_i1.p1  ORF type:complete len:955 (+),score=203.29 TRINITY_DN11825_c0_g1_i1:119-2983(+)
MSDGAADGPISVVLLASAPFLGQEWLVKELFPDHRHFCSIQVSRQVGFCREDENEFFKKIIEAISIYKNNIVVDHTVLHTTAAVFARKLVSRLGSKHEVKFKLVRLQTERDLSFSSLWASSWHLGQLLRLVVEQPKHELWNGELPDTLATEFDELTQRPIKRVDYPTPVEELEAVTIPLMLPKLYKEGLACLFLDFAVVQGQQTEDDVFTPALVNAISKWKTKAKQATANEDELAPAAPVMVCVLKKPDVHPYSQDSQTARSIPTEIAALSRAVSLPVFFVEPSPRLWERSETSAIPIAAVAFAALMEVDLQHPSTVLVVEDDITMAKLKGLGCRPFLWSKVEANPKCLRADVNIHHNKDPVLSNACFGAYCSYDERRGHSAWHDCIDADLARLYEPTCEIPAARLKLPLVVPGAEQRCVTIKGIRLGYYSSGRMGKVLDEYHHRPEQRLTQQPVLQRLRQLSIPWASRGERTQAGTNAFTADTQSDDDDDDNPDKQTVIISDDDDMMAPGPVRSKLGRPSLDTIQTLLGDGKAMERAQDSCCKLFDLQLLDDGGVCASCKGSKDEVYKVTCHMAADGSVGETSCNCLFRHDRRVCKHRGAVLLVLHYNPTAFRKGVIEASKLPFLPSALPVPRPAPNTTATNNEAPVTVLLTSPQRPDTMVIPTAKTSPRYRQHPKLVRRDTNAPRTHVATPVVPLKTNSTGGKRRALPSVITSVAAGPEPKASKQSSTKRGGGSRTATATSNSKPGSGRGNKGSANGSIALTAERLQQLCRAIDTHGWQACGFAAADFDDPVARAFGHARHVGSSQESPRRTGDSQPTMAGVGDKLSQQAGDDADDEHEDVKKLQSQATSQAHATLEQKQRRIVQSAVEEVKPTINPIHAQTDSEPAAKPELSQASKPSSPTDELKSAQETADVLARAQLEQLLKDHILSDDDDDNDDDDGGNTGGDLDDMF